MSIYMEEWFKSFPERDIDNDLGGKQLVVFGVGGNGLGAKRFLEAQKLSVRFFCDNDSSKWGGSVDGIEVLSPSQLELLSKDNPQVVVCIASMWAAEIADQLRSLNIKYLDLSYYWQQRWKAHFSRDMLASNAYELDRLHSRLADDESREVLKSIVSYRLSFDPTFLRRASFRQYDHPEINFECIDSNLCIFDGGAFDGRSALFFAERASPALKGAEPKIFSFEPDPKSFERLTDLVSHVEYIKPVNMGLSLVTKTAFMAAGSTSAQNTVSADGAVEIRLTSVDDFCEAHGLRPAVIKMDIEGSESDAISGAKVTIASFSPVLIVCIYHKPDDLWSIVNQICDINPGYQYYLAHHSQSITESVLYAVPGPE